MTTQTERLEIANRPRRNRKSPAIRDLFQETRLDPSKFIAPLFIIDGENQKDPINSMPDVYRLTIDQLLKEVEALIKVGVRSINLFPYIPAERKDALASEAFRSNNLISRAISTVKQEFPEVCVMVDVALDPYTDHGHDGLLDNNGYVANDITVEALARQSILMAEAGADIVTPSDMMDGRIGYIRKELDDAGFDQVGIISYAVKFVSAFYGPFRDALNSAPRFGDKKTYQVNPANCREALLECLLDENEGADALIIKPGLPYLDVIVKAKEQTHLPIGAYHVSGEYAMIMAAGQKGWLDADRAMEESLLSIRRAGADFILTYAARKIAERLLLQR